MNFKNTFKYHVILGLIIVGMHIFDMYINMGISVLTDKLRVGIIYLITFHSAFFIVYAVNYLLICPIAIVRKKLGWAILGFISMFFLFAGVRYFLEEVLVYSVTGTHNYVESSRKFWFYIIDNSYYAIKAILFSTFMFVLFNYLRTKSKMHQLELEQQKTELGALRMQLEPHFLFNTLNIFYTELIETQPEAAKGIYKLSELLRYLTYEAKNDFSPLTKELKFIEDYIFFYKKRYENNLYVEYTIEGEVTSKEIPSLVLIHFIENIFKHGIINDKRQPAHISIKVDDSHLELKTKNKISEVKNYSENGLGKENLEKRLLLIYGSDFTFTQSEKDQYYSTYLKLPLKS